MTAEPAAPQPVEPPPADRRYRPRHSQDEPLVVAPPEPEPFEPESRVFGPTNLSRKRLGVAPVRLLSAHVAADSK